MHNTVRTFYCRVKPIFDQMDSSICFVWMSPFLVLEISGECFHFHRMYNRNFCKDTVRASEQDLYCLHDTPKRLSRLKMVYRVDDFKAKIRSRQSISTPSLCTQMGKEINEDAKRQNKTIKKPRYQVFLSKLKKMHKTSKSYVKPTTNDSKGKSQ